MKRQLVTAEPSESVRTASRKLADHNLGALLIVEDSKLVGLFSERDLMRRVVVLGNDIDTLEVGAVATSSPRAVYETTPIRECSQIIRELGIRHLPVIDEEGRAIGIISSRDLLQFVVDGLESFIEKQFSDRHFEEMTDSYDSLADDFDD